MRRLLRGRKGRFVKDDPVHDVMVIAASSLRLLNAAREGVAVPEPPDVYEEAIDAHGRAEFEAMRADLRLAAEGAS